MRNNQGHLTENLEAVKTASNTTPQWKWKFMSAHPRTKAMKKVFSPQAPARTRISTSIVVWCLMQFSLLPDFR
jgi:hypothetical protein